MTGVKYRPQDELKELFILHTSAESSEQLAFLFTEREP
jgi:hypothetical protein